MTRSWRRAIAATVMMLSLGCIVAAWIMLRPPKIGPPQHELPATIDELPGIAWLHGQDFVYYFNGHTEAEFVEKYGNPNLRWCWEPSNDPTKDPGGARVEFEYTCRSGTIYLSFCRQDGKMVCCNSAWSGRCMDGNCWLRKWLSNSPKLIGQHRQKAPEWISPPRHELPDTLDAIEALSHLRINEGRDRFNLSDYFVGFTEVALVEKYGIPNGRGHFALIDAPAIVYTCPTGSLYLWFREQDGKMVCFSSMWLPEGGVF